MKARLYHTDDHPMLAEWWVGHGGAAVPEVMLPKIGVIANDGTDDLAAAFVYFDDSKPIAFVAWFVTKPKITAAQANAALACVLGAVEILAEDNHCTLVMPIVEKPSLKAWLLSNGYILGCDGASILVKTK